MLTTGCGYVDWGRQAELHQLECPNNIFGIRHLAASLQAQSCRASSWMPQQCLHSEDFEWDGGVQPWVSRVLQSSCLVFPEGFVCKLFTSIHLQIHSRSRRSGDKGFPGAQTSVSKYISLKWQGSRAAKLQMDFWQAEFWFLPVLVRPVYRNIPWLSEPWLDSDLWPINWSWSLLSGKWQYLTSNTNAMCSACFGCLQCWGTSNSRTFCKYIFVWCL